MKPSFRPLFRAVIPIVTSIAMLLTLPGGVAAGNDEQDNPIREWIVLTGEGESAQVKRSLGRDAKQAGISPKQLAARYLDEYRMAQEQGQIKPLDQTRDSDAAQQSAAEGSGFTIVPADTKSPGEVRLPRARRKGDFFYHSSSTWGYDHGHNGLYRWRGMIVEAANDRLGVRKIRIRNKRTGRIQRFVPRGTYILKRTGVNKSKRATMTKWARRKVGANYRAWWKHNRKMGAPYNCSQLVWAAYKKVGIELDTDNGWHDPNFRVYPREIATANNVYYYNRAGM